MNSKFTLWAQALDNTSPDHIEVRGEILAAADALQRQAAVSRVAGVVKREKWTFKEGWVRLVADGSHFVFEIPSEQRDSAGRIAPIVCCGDYDSTLCDVLGSSTASALTGFASRIGRTLSPAHLDLAKVFFDELKKKSTQSRLQRNLIFLAVSFLLLLAMCLAKQKTASQSTLKQRVSTPR